MHLDSYFNGPLSATLLYPKEHERKEDLSYRNVLFHGHPP